MLGSPINKTEMFWDDPNPTVATARVRYETVSNALEGFEYCVDRVKWLSNKRMVGLRKVNKDEEEAAAINGCKFL